MTGPPARRLRRVWPAFETNSDAQDPEWATGVAVAPGGAWLASADDDGTVRLWSAATGRCTATLRGHRATVAAVAISPDGRWLASAGFDRTVRLWDVLTGAERARLGHRREVCAIAIAPDGTWLVTAGGDQNVRLWDIASGRRHATLRGHSDVVAAVDITADGTRIVTAGEDNFVLIWRVGQDYPHWIARAPGGDRGDDITPLTDVSIAGDGTWLATAGYDVRLWDGVTGELLDVLSGHSDEVNSVEISPDGTLIATAGDDNTLRLWDVASGEQLDRVDTAVTVDDVCWAPDGGSVYTAGAAGVIRYDVEP